MIFSDGRKNVCRNFTLVELMVALGILALSLAALFSMFMAARQRIGKAAEEWNNMHMISQAAEYLLLHNSDVDTVPEHFFPYKEYTVSVSYEDIDNLPEEMQGQTGQLDLQACVISLIRYQDGKVVDSIIVDRIMYDSSNSYSPQD